jgi:hypothetical protein
MLMTKNDITNYLTNLDLQGNYVCGDGTFCEMLSRRALPSEVFAQTSVGPNLPGRNWWIEYLDAQNKFVLRCSYFDANETPITREQFIELLKPNLSSEKIARMPAVLYTPEAVIEWLPTGEGEWTATYSVSTPTSGCMIVGPLSKILHKSVAPTPTPTPQPTTGTCWAVINSDASVSNTIHWVDANGVERSEQGVPGNSVLYICSQVQPHESPAGNIVISSCNKSCTNICESLTCDMCEC